MRLVLRAILSCSAIILSPLAVNGYVCLSARRIGVEDECLYPVHAEVQAEPGFAVSVRMTAEMGTMLD